MVDKVSVTARSTFTAYDDNQMVVANAGETVELTEATAQAYIESGMADLAKGKKKAVAASEPAAEEQAPA